MVDPAHGGMTMVVVTQGMGFERRVAGRVVVMDEGGTVETAPQAAEERTGLPQPNPLALMPAPAGWPVRRKQHEFQASVSWPWRNIYCRKLIAMVAIVPTPCRSTSAIFMNTHGRSLRPQEVV